MPLLWAKKEVFTWIKTGKKTIDVRKGNPQRGEIAFFQCGPHFLRLRITKKESGLLIDIVRQDNFTRIIPSALTLEAAIDYLRKLYGDYDDVFTAYYLET